MFQGSALGVESLKTLTNGERVRRCYETSSFPVLQTWTLFTHPFLNTCFSLARITENKKAPT